jgi:hypothetical protein
VGQVFNLRVDFIGALRGYKPRAGYNPAPQSGQAYRFR